ncbi:hypothetical protein QVD17_32162 [Tagetes erecta]|uniref:LysM domain-containing protein n=1 Tax=Tagetes erecta TaxID=13708 RepID=A0AAD8NPW3_TARER|nr:hypothetical protein QVD17_32162 [Tagetes erecta]
MRLQRRNGGDNYWNRRLDRGFFMESPSHSKLFCNDSSASLIQPLSAVVSSRGGGLGLIEHTVTKFDTLAGVAIKYGVEVADIKKMNGLTTDLQMFSRKTLYIPLPGRHPPSPIMSNGNGIQGPKMTEMTPPNRRRSDLFDSIKSLKLSSSSPQTISPSMDALRDYYGLKPTNQNGISERFSPGAYPKAGSFSIEHDTNPSQSSHPPAGLHRKCKSLAHGLSEKGSVMNGDAPVANGKNPDSDTWYDNLMRRRLSEIDLQNHTPEMLLKPDTTNTTSAFSPAAGKGLALRPTATSRTANDPDGMQNMPPLKLGDSSIFDAFSGVKKSSSSPSFYDSYNNSNSNNNSNSSTSISSIWPTSMLNLTVDLQALSTAAITRPIFDGLPKPISGRKNKAAID